MEELVEKLGEGMRLSEGEKARIVITEDETADLRVRSGRCLIGRIMSDRRIQKEAFKAFMARLWKTTGKVSFKELEDNYWLLEFSSEADKKRVLEGCPWLFDRNILVLREVEESTPPTQMDFSLSPCWVQVRDIPLICMNKEVGNKIGETIGMVEEVDVSGNGPGRGSSLRIKIQIDITKPLERGRALWLNGKLVWVNFRYEKLPHFCFNCGRIVHIREQCSESREAKQEGEEEPKRWGTWLRAEEVRPTQGRKWPGNGRMSSHPRQEAKEQKEAEGGGGEAADEKIDGRGESPDHHGGDSNKHVSKNSIGNDTEKQILQSILRKEVWDTKAAEQLQSPKRRSDNMELMQISDQLEMEYYPPVNEELTKKSTEDKKQEGKGKDHPPGKSTNGPSIERGGNLHSKVGPGLESDPLELDSGEDMEGSSEDNFGSDKGPNRRWKRRKRPPSLSPDPQKGGKRNLSQAGIEGDKDSPEGGKKARLEVKMGSDMAWAEAGFQPRQPQ